MPVGALAVSNRTRLTGKLEGEYPTNYGVVQAGNGFNIDYTGETLKFTPKFQQSKVMRSDRQPSGSVPVGAEAMGGINLEHRYAGLDPWYASIIGNAWSPFGTNGVGAAVTTMTFTATTVTADVATTGVNLWTTLRKGQWFVIVPPVGATAAIKTYLKRRAFRVSPTVAPTSTVITVDAATPLDTAILGANMAGGKISSAYLDNGTRMWSYSLEVAHEDAGVIRLYPGMIPGKVSWKLTDGDMVSGSVEFIGRDMSLPVATAMGVPTAAPAFSTANATRGIFDIFQNGTSITAVTYIKTMDFTIDGSLRPQTALGVFGTARIAQGTFKITGTMEMYLADKTMYQNFIDTVKGSITVPILDEDGNGYVYHFAKCTYTAAEANATGDNQDVMLKVTFDAEFDSDPLSPNFNKMIAVYRVGSAVTP